MTMACSGAVAASWGTACDGDGSQAPSRAPCNGDDGSLVDRWLSTMATTLEHPSRAPCHGDTIKEVGNH
ncbi:hypothetical protein E2562_022022 [Oryza meyeriana var. granulata]|uniref:Uncharacterized protein n=1 Tax=Oryza meyeriana var. granulata TaxID=110450 RepID=A0A6G1ENK4_9ORYZ|nr:hypothetical protein E2562_022022 [Oryza meyeriana var. granulata]